MAMNENTRKILDYVIEHDGEDFTVADVAAALDMPVRGVNGSVTALGRSTKSHPDALIERIPAEIEVDGAIKNVSFVRVTEAGKTFANEE